MSKFFGCWKISLLLGLAIGAGVTAADVADDTAKECLKIKEMSPGYSGKFIWGMFTDNRKLAEVQQLKEFTDQFPADKTVEIIRYITPGGIGEKEGLKTGDIVLEKSAYSSVTSRPGEKIQMKVWRSADKRLEDITVTLPQYYQIKFEPYIKPAGAVEFEKTLPPDWENYAHYLLQPPLRENFDDLRQRLTDIDSLTDAYRLPVFRYLIRNPFRLEQVSRGWIDKISAVEAWPELLKTTEYMLKFAPGTAVDPVADFLKENPYPGDSAGVEDISGFYFKVLQRCSDLNMKAFAKISAEEKKFIRENRHAALNSICKYHMLSYEPDTASARRTLKIFEILNRIDFSALWQQAETAALLRNEALLERLKKLFAGRQGILYKQDSPLGEIVIGGFGEDVYKNDAALIIDLGGNDRYLNNQATPVAGRFSTAVIVDCAGDDYYSSTDAAGQGCGDLGVGMLLDLAGNDTYCGIEMVQGSAFGGIGILYDGSGDDTYHAVRMSQAAAFFGAGLLLDQSGNDRYNIQHFGQALGSVRGIGILQDGSGNDVYMCKGSQLSSYNTRGNFDGWGQGIGFGVRPFASGGIGILLDKNGRDRYDGGTFTQGGGYYYSYGLFCDQGNDADFYQGTHYSQGFAAHQALGAFIEKGGNDVYRTLHAVSLGLSWDETVVLFADDNGDDDYDSGGSIYSFASAHQNGICFFFDRGGNDRYVGTQAAPRNTNGYHLGTSLGIFIDSGHGSDQYSERSNNTSLSEAGDHIFIDK